MRIPPIISRGDATSLHELLWSLGKSLVTGEEPPLEKPSAAAAWNPALLGDKLQHSTAQQIVTALHMLGINEYEEHMVASLRDMLQAGEMNFTDFIGRLQNLFPKLLDDLDVTLRMKIAAQMVQP